MTFKIVICLCFISITGILGKEERVFGGVEAQISEFPYVASIRVHHQNQFLCAATIISRWSVLTLAVRIFPYQNALDSLRVSTGTSSSFHLVESHKIQEVMIHPFFQMHNPLNNNLCIVKLQRKLRFNEFQYKIPLARVSYRSGIMAWIVGWGITNPSGAPTLGLRLRKAVVHTLHATQCSGLVPLLLSDNHFCTYQGAGVGVIPGDGGGPVVVDDQLYGIILYSGQQNGNNAPDIHASVYHHYNFIALGLDD